MKSEGPLKINDISEIDIVVPLYNEEKSVLVFHDRLVAALAGLPYNFKLLYIDDGSTDQTPIQLFSLTQDERITVVRLSRNFGHQAALTAGMDLADGDVVITLDGDGQHPPELIPTMIAKYLDGFEIVQMQRIDNAKTGFFKKITSRWFYWLINKLGEIKISPGTSDFRLMSHAAILAFREMKEYHKFIRGIIPWLGYPTVDVSYTAQERIAGDSKYTFKKMFTLAENAIFSFSLVPLRISFGIGVGFLLLAVLEALYVAFFWITGRQSSLAPGWSSIVFLILITGGSLIVLISLLGIYIGQIHQEVKNRPGYIIQKQYNRKNE